MASFWLMSGGMLFMTFTLTFAGTVQTHLQRVNGEAYMDVQDQLAIFYWMRFGSGVAVVLGALLFIYSVAVVRREVFTPARFRPTRTAISSRRSKTMNAHATTTKEGAAAPSIFRSATRSRCSRPRPATTCRCC